MIKRFYLLTVIALTFFSCGKGGDVVPSVSFTYQSDINNPTLAALKSPGGAVIIPGYGVAGLIIYREPDLSYAAYDACSSYMPQKHCAVTIDGNSLTVTDPCSGSKFSLADGTPVKAPATRSLRAYTVNVSNFEIFVSN
jgi:nitrite reductase/ring-hydroxylating ferredoxin subunit